jgi:hypothetical protein
MRFWFWQRQKAERIYEQTMFFASRESCWWCSECDAIGESGSRCPRCQSSALLNLSRVLPRQSDGCIRLEAV